MLLLNKSFIFCRYYAYLNTAVKYKMLKSMCMPSIVTWKSFFSSPHLQWLCAERAECIKKLFNSFLLIVFVNDEHWCLLFKMYFTRITHECLLDTEMQFWWKISIFFLFFLLYGVHQHSIFVNVEINWISRNQNAFHVHHQMKAKSFFSSFDEFVQN